MFPRPTQAAYPTASRRWQRADAAATVLEGKEMVITVDLGTGGAHEATMWTCDFSKEYVTINAEYRT